VNKVLVVILDGLGDRVYKELNNLTPLEAANTPVLDLLAAKSICGLLYPLGVSIRPSSDIAHMALFGLDYKREYTGRGPIELSGLGIKMTVSDLALRGNFAVADKNGVIKDRRAGRKSPPAKLLHELSKIDIENYLFELHYIAEHRFALKIIGNELSDNITDSDPHIENVPLSEVCPADSNSSSACYTAYLINSYIEKVRSILSKHDDYPANNILLRGVGTLPNWYDFNEKYKMKSACITNNALYNGIGSLLGMKVILPNRYLDYNNYYKNIENLVLQTFNNYDFIFLHLQEADLFGEDGDVYGKTAVIEKIDSALNFINSLPDNILVSVTSDHSTPCCLKAHSGDSVPILFHGEGLRNDTVCTYGERSFTTGGLGTIEGKDFMPTIMNFLGRAELVGS